ncbi:hypothetical protein GLYMA_09G166700v4 [Glycine max]|uniref:Uncharacterized protein n=1 Tax=Glycine max TaxID=3847 RepID=A0A0R0IFN4_SOYBN|nr:hypothetical protein GYH30_025276 [Glycine max]KRH38921.1 hypothetical protein GLYMA_09G166700v4 [Glycine max]
MHITTGWRMIDSNFGSQKKICVAKPISLQKKIKKFVE